MFLLSWPAGPCLFQAFLFSPIAPSDDGHMTQASAATPTSKRHNGGGSN